MTHQLDLAFHFFGLGIINSNTRLNEVHVEVKAHIDSDAMGRMTGANVVQKVVEDFSIPLTGKSCDGISQDVTISTKMQ
jgi:hypothetical protein